LFNACWKWLIKLPTLVGLLFVWHFLFLNKTFRRCWTYTWGSSIFSILLWNVRRSAFFFLFWPLFLCFASEKQREFYKNAKYVSKFKKKLKQQHQPNELHSDVRPSEVWDRFFGPESFVFFLLSRKYLVCFNKYHHCKVFHRVLLTIY
jgi:hypothetical protein